jgi:hypothetical protein
VTALCCGVGTLVISALVKLTPNDWIEKLKGSNNEEIDRDTFMTTLSDQISFFR